MSKTKYLVKVQSDHLAYEFISSGPNGNIVKIVIYQHMFDNFYNLAFGDQSGHRDFFDDLVVF